MWWCFRLANTLERLMLYFSEMDFFILMFKKKTMQEYKGISLDHMDNVACK